MHYASWCCSRVFAVSEYWPAVDKNMNHAGCVLMGIFKGGVVLDGFGVKDHDIRKEPGFQ